jgi:hypothetical protein
MRTSLAILFVATSTTACVTADTGPLSLDVHSSDRVAGTYSERDALIEFDISRAPDQHSTALRRGDGTPIVNIDVAGVRQRVTVLDGALVIDGVLGAPDPVVHGDLFAMRTLERERDLAMIAQVYEHLDMAGVDTELLAPPAPPPSEHQVVADGATMYWWSSFGPGARTFELVNSNTGCTAVRMGSFPGSTEVVLARGSQALTRYGWSGLIHIENLGAWTAWDEPVCEAAPVRVRVIP